VTGRLLDTPWLTKREAAERARVSASVLDQAIRSGQLRSRKIGRRRILHVDWVDAWLAEQDDAA
jgi:excisionase family DNA binding protein